MVFIKILLASALLLGVQSIKCNIGDESGVSTYQGFDYCTTKLGQWPFSESYGGEKFQRGFDKPITRLGKECSPKLEGKGVNLNCRCFEDNCNIKTSIKDVLKLKNLYMLSLI